MSENNTLQKAQESMVAEISPFLAKSLDIRARAAIQEVTTEISLASAVALKKEITGHRTLVKDARMTVTRKIDNLKKAIMNKEEEILLPLDNAQNDLGEKILTYEEEQDRIRREETARVDGLVLQVSISSVYDLKTPAEVDTKDAELNKIYTAMKTADKDHPDVKLKKTQSTNQLADRKAYILEQIEQQKERDRLAEEAKEQSAERAKLEEEKAAADARERKIQDEKDRLEREKQRKLEEDKAEEDRKDRERADRNRVKTGARTVVTIEIVDETVIPREFCSPDMVKIRAAVKAGTPVAGISVTREKKV